MVALGNILPAQTHNVQLLPTEPAHKRELEVMVNTYTPESQTIQVSHVLLNLVRVIQLTRQDVRQL